MTSNVKKNNKYIDVQHAKSNGKQDAANLFKVDQKRSREWTQNKTWRIVKKLLNDEKVVVEQFFFLILRRNYEIHAW